MKQTFARKSFDAVINVPISAEIKALIVCLSRAKGLYAPTALARSYIVKGLFQAVKELGPEERRILDVVASSTLIADRIEEVMLSELRPTN